MDCPTWEEQISTLVDDELEDGEAAALFSHLALCSSCRGFYRKVMTLREDLKDTLWVAASPGEGQPQGPSRAPTNVRRAPSPRGAVVRIRRSVAVGAAAFLLAVGGSAGALLMGQSDGSQVETVVFVGSLPTVEISASYLKNSSKGL